MTTFLEYVEKYPSTLLPLSSKEKSLYSRPEVESVWQELLDEMGFKGVPLSKEDFLHLSILFSIRLKEKADKVSGKDLHNEK